MMKNIIIVLFIPFFGFSQETEQVTSAYSSESYMAHRYLEWGMFEEAIKTQKKRHRIMQT
ncbi:hypothetical protein WPG_2326 [Winogradskyella sp. PG-2]|nr:hypothetical protein WPG_2326 [Winogradskyella sp. PG-2]